MSRWLCHQDGTVRGPVVYGAALLLGLVWVGWQEASRPALRPGMALPPVIDEPSRPRAMGAHYTLNASRPATSVRMACGCLVPDPDDPVILTGRAD